MLKHEIISHVEELPVFINYYEQDTHLIPSHWHNHIEVLYIKSGTMEIVLNDASYTLKENDLFVINSGYIHLTRSEGIAKVLLLQIPYEMFDQSIREMASIRFQDYFPYDEWKHNLHYRQMVSTLMEMLNLYQTKDAGYQFLFNSELYQLLHQLYLHFSKDIGTPKLSSNDRQRVHLQKAVDYLNLNYKEAISLGEIASHLALNPEYFCRIFKKNMGFTFLEYLNQIRLTHIYDDLLNTNDSITQLQERHGFTNYKVFSRMFKGTYGCKPSDVRKSAC